LTEESLASGAKGFVSKPYNMKQLLRAVRHTLDTE
jgi:FixJ family two-component response regulator